MPLISDEFDTLTKDQQYILYVLYKDYLECVKLGIDSISKIASIIPGL
ncbi:TPA: hypothetical protein PEN11_002509 [Staphylococcus aureus]|nr:hypothetical protein [Staphylococcus aureus]